MTKEEYIRELRARIFPIYPKEEQDVGAAVLYGNIWRMPVTARWSRSIEELGTPQQVAERIIADCAQSAVEGKICPHRMCAGNVGGGDQSGLAAGAVCGRYSGCDSVVYHRFAHLCLWSGCAGTHRGRHLVADPLSSNRNCGAGRCADLCGFDAAVCRTVLVGSRCGQIGLEDDKTKKKRLMRAHAR